MKRSIKCALSLILAVCILASFVALPICAGDRYVTGNVVSTYFDNLWTYDRETRVLIITSNKTGYNESGSIKYAEEWNDFFDELEEIVLVGNISKITGGAFKGASRLKKVTMPETVKQIDASAFHDCKSLETVCVEGHVCIPGILDFSTIVGSNAKGDASFARSDIFNCETKASAVILSDKYSDVPSVEGDETSAPALNAKNLPDNIRTIYGSSDYLEKFCKANGFTFVPFGKSSDNQLAWTIGGSSVSFVGGSNIKDLGPAAEKYTDRITRAVITSNISVIGDGALASLPNLEYVVFTGDAPKVVFNGKPFGQRPESFYLYVMPDVSGFDGDTWCGYRVYVPHYMSGDVNDDGKVNAKDAVMLAQYLANWSVNVKNESTDVDGDGSINAKDAVLLAQYLANWDVALIGPAIPAPEDPPMDPELGDVEINPDDIFVS